ncbi:MAG: hypothetical protein CYPHOPRED_004300 [Cyphobasidiales sp. Tagirdzhanova-0007]|nr:MAG: hypothetical protein CYPHOPRED_004300 [Cyphobasidiales sp. Tagirdzhanova-0007]
MADPAVPVPVVASSSSSSSPSSSMATFSSSSASVHAAKHILRHRVRASLVAIDDASLAAQSAAVTARVLAHPSYIAADRLSIYISMPTSELRTDDIVRHALSSHKKLFIPCTTRGSNSTMRMLRLKSTEDFQHLIPDRWKIRGFPKDGLEDGENG